VLTGVFDGTGTAEIDGSKLRAARQQLCERTGLRTATLRSRRQSQLRAFASSTLISRQVLSILQQVKDLRQECSFRYMWAIRFAPPLAHR